MRSTLSLFNPLRMSKLSLVKSWLGLGFLNFAFSSFLYFKKWYFSLIVVCFIPLFSVKKHFFNIIYATIHLIMLGSEE